MDSKEGKSETESRGMVLQVFKEFLMCVTKIEELGIVGSKLINAVQQGLAFLQRPPINNTSILLGNIIKNNETKTLKSYISAGCFKCEDHVQSMSQLHSCLRGLKDHLTKVKSTLNELESIMKNATAALQTAIECSSRSTDNDIAHELDHQAPDNKDETTSCCQREITDYAEIMVIIYSMLKQDYIMQEKIVSSLRITTSTSVLESYCLMWSLRPFVNDDIVRQGWRLIP